MKSDQMLVRLAEIAASATALHRAMSGLPEPSETTELVNRVLEIAIGAGRGEEPIPMPARHPRSLLQMVERWHELGDLIDATPPVFDGKPFDRDALIRAGDYIHERANIEKQIGAGGARGDADLIAKAGVLRRLIEQDSNAEDRCGRLTLSVLDDIEQIIGGAP